MWRARFTERATAQPRSELHDYFAQTSGKTAAASPVVCDAHDPLSPRFCFCPAHFLARGEGGEGASGVADGAAQDAVPGLPQCGEKEGRAVLETRDLALKGGENGAALSAGDAATAR